MLRALLVDTVCFYSEYRGLIRTSVPVFDSDFAISRQYHGDNKTPDSFHVLSNLTTRKFFIFIEFETMKKNYLQRKNRDNIGAWSSL